MNPADRPLCFVLMPFGTKPDGTGRAIDFDRVYDEIIRLAAEAEGMRCLRADEERVGGIIHKPMYERLLLCEYAVADLTMANANVFYELGIRHAARPRSTVLTYAEGFRLPFDVGPLRGTRYRLDDGGLPDRVEEDRESLRADLAEARKGATDSPLFQLCLGLEPLDLVSLDSEEFQARALRAERIRAELDLAETAAEVSAVRAQLAGLDGADAGLLIELLLTYRGVNGFEEIVTLVEQMPPDVARHPQIREQWALALNRLGRSAEAEAVLLALLRERGPSSETFGLLGRVYKDRWETALRQGEGGRAAGFLRKAIDAYLRGFESDWRDPYPGVNAVQLIWLQDHDDPRLAELVPVVQYGARHKVTSGGATYWDYATLLELALYADDLDTALRWLGDALAADPRPMEAESTLATVRRVRAHVDPQRAIDAWDTLERELEAEAFPSTPNGR